MSLTQVLHLTVEAELKRCLTYNCCQETGLRGAPARLLARPGFFCHSLWEGSPPGAMFPWEDKRLELTYGLFLARYPPLSRTHHPLWKSGCHSVSQSLPTAIPQFLPLPPGCCLRQKGSSGLSIQVAHKSLRGSMTPELCAQLCVCVDFWSTHPETPPESQWCPRPT